MNKKLITLVVILIILMSATFVTYGNEIDTNDIQVKVYNRDLNINGEIINNFHSEYPFFSYNDILYMPLTWENSQIYGFEVEYNGEDNTLYVSDGQSTEKNYTFQWLKQNWREIDVKKSNLKVNINDVNVVDENYPILEFNYVQYIPLTYSVVVEQLNWDFLIDRYMGLHISTVENIPAYTYFDEDKSNYYMHLKEYISIINKKISEYEAVELVMLIKEKCELYDVDEMLIAATMWQESWYKSGTYYQGAIGLMQIMYYTGDNYGLTVEMLYDPEINVDFGVKYLKDRIDIYDGDIEKALVAYNMGVTRVNRGNYPTRYYDGVMEKKGKIENYLIKNGVMEPKTEEIVKEEQ